MFKCENCSTCEFNFKKQDRIALKDNNNEDIKAEICVKENLEKFGIYLKQTTYKYCPLDLYNDHTIIDVKNASATEEGVRTFGHGHGLLVETQKLVNLYEIENKTKTPNVFVMYLLSDGSMWATRPSIILYHEHSIDNMIKGKPAKYLDINHWTKIVSYESLFSVSKQIWRKCKYCSLNVYGEKYHLKCREKALELEKKELKEEWGEEKKRLLGLVRKAWSEGKDTESNKSFYDFCMNNDIEHP